MKSRAREEADKYLNEYEKALSKIDPLLKKDLVDKLSKYFEEEEAQGGQNRLHNAVRGMGSPSYIARKHLEARGLQVKKNNKTLMWILILLTIPILLIGGCSLAVYHFFTTSDFEFLEEMDSNFRVQFSSGEAVDFLQSQLVKEQKRLLLTLGSGQLNLFAQDTDKISVDCKLEVSDINLSRRIKTVEENLVFELNERDGFKCNIEYPNHLEAVVSMKNGNLKVYNPNADTKIALDNGRFYFHGNPSKNYDFEILVRRGNINGLKEGSDRTGPKIKVDIQNGMAQFKLKDQ